MWIDFMYNAAKIVIGCHAGKRRKGKLADVGKQKRAAFLLSWQTALWASSLCHSLVPHTRKDLLLCYSVTAAFFN